MRFESDVHFAMPPTMALSSAESVDARESAVLQVVVRDRRAVKLQHTVNHRIPDFSVLTASVRPSLIPSTAQAKLNFQHNIIREIEVATHEHGVFQ